MLDFTNKWPASSFHGCLCFLLIHILGSQIQLLQNVTAHNSNAHKQHNDHTEKTRHNGMAPVPVNVLSHLL
jgi:hypothetical protein